MKRWSHLLVIVASLAALSSAMTTSQARDSGEVDFEKWRSRPEEPFTDGQAMFERVKETLEQHYLKADITEDEFYRAAVAGLLSGIDPDRSSWNRLLTPTEFAELTADIEGKVVGIGIEVSFDTETGYGQVLDVIAGTPAAAQGIKRGDQILKIDGKSYRGRQLRDFVYAIRGQAGTSVTLTLLQDGAVVEVTVERAPLVWENVRHEMLGDGVGLITIQYFSKQTPELVKAALTALKAEQPKALIFDLRGNAGGLLDSAIGTARLVVPKDGLIVTALGREGEREEYRGNAAPIIANLPLAVLVNGETKSGAEIFAGALSENLDATLIGSKTFGKWSAQKLEKLPNEYAIKYTTTLFLSPSGSSLDGKGLKPDVMVDMTDELRMKVAREKDRARRLAADTQLAAAWSIMAHKP